MKVPTVLLYGLEAEQERLIKAHCLVKKIRVHQIQPQEIFLPLGRLCGLEQEQEPGEAEGKISEPLLIMAHFSPSLRDGFLRELRRRKIPPISLKAVLTPTNQSWSLLELYEELKREREAFEGRGAPG